MRMQTFIILYILILIFTFVSCYIQPMPRQEGFGEILWGTPINEFSGIACYLSTTHAIAYKEPDELKIGSATCQSFRYYFLNGKFAAVVIEVKGYSNWIALKALASEKYGSLARCNKVREQYEKRSDQTIVCLVYNKATERGGLISISKICGDNREKSELLSAIRIYKDSERTQTD